MIFVNDHHTVHAGVDSRYCYYYFYQLEECTEK